MVYITGFTQFWNRSPPVSDINDGYSAVSFNQWLAGKLP
ncbi:hypothetical protein l13_15580 [Neisseria weaveri ATCC 51223]|nr:hypothetical protein l13_15580 [Neisseria weaveri ATCC 51223]